MTSTEKVIANKYLHYKYYCDGKTNESFCNSNSNRALLSEVLRLRSQTITGHTAPQQTPSPLLKWSSI